MHAEQAPVAGNFSFGNEEKTLIPGDELTINSQKLEACRLKASPPNGTNAASPRFPGRSLQIRIPVR